MHMAAHTPESGTVSSGASDPFLRSTIEALRRRLLDLTGRNPLLNFRHGRNRRHLRVIDELPDQLFAKLEGDSVLRFRSVGENETEPRDERTPEFGRALEEARLHDEAYVQGMAELAARADRGEEPGEKALARLELELRLRVRESLGMVSRAEAMATTPADAARKLGLEPSFDLPGVPGAEASAQEAGAAGTSGQGAGGTTSPRPGHSDNIVQTLLFEEELVRVLSTIRDQTRLSMSESGVNPLFMVFGFLEWYEEASSDQPLHAPLMLYQVSIDYELVRGKQQHNIKSVGDGPQMNVALAERLKRDFNLVLPQIEEGETPEAYMARVAEVVAGMKAWRVRRWMTLGMFSFARIAMYHDLDLERWGGALEGNATLSRVLAGGSAGAQGASEAALVGSTESAGSAALAEPEDELSLSLIADADSSQAQAVRHALAGQSMVIEGPPGTGKSQTITNIIAAALASGKRVLFVAEKLAALTVVKKRLEDAGLGAFCLELHSTKAARREVFGVFARRLALEKPRSVARDLASTLENLGLARDQIEACVRALGAQAGRLGCSVQELLWRCGAARERTGWLPEAIDEIVYARAPEVTRADLGRIKGVAAHAARCWGALAARHDGAQQCPWFGLVTHESDPMGAEELVRRMRAFEPLAARLASLGVEVATLTGWDAPSVDALQHACARASNLGRVPPGLGSAVVSREGAAHGERGQAMRSLVREMGALVGLAQDRIATTGAERLLVRAACLARDASDALLGARTEPLCAPGAEGAIEHIRERVTALCAERATLEEGFALEGLRPDALREHARAVRAAPALPWISPSWWRARGFIKGISKRREKLDRQSAASALERVAAHIDAWEAFAAEPSGRALLGERFAGARTELGVEGEVALWAAEVRRTLGAGDAGAMVATDFLLRGSAERVRALGMLATGDAFEGLLEVVGYVERVEGAGLPEAIRAWLLEEDASARGTRLAALASDALEALLAWHGAFEPIAGGERASRVDARAWLGVERFVDARPDAVHARARACVADPESLGLLADALRARVEACDEGAGPVIEVVERVRPDLQGLDEAVGRVILQSLTAHALREHEALRRFSGERHESQRARFRELDARLIELRQREIAARLMQRPVDPGSDRGAKRQWTGRALVEHVAATPRTPTHLREVFDRAGEAVQQLVPCFMMSPLSVAQYLEPAGMRFDIVIMDEASQMRPEDAVGAIARGAQVIVVGDPKQLPPTSFFMGSDTTPGQEREGTAADEQSILDQAMATLRPVRRLKWHYRSRHASLIEFSNRMFYDGELVVFPSPHHEHPDFGVRLVHVADGVYGGRVNVPEARRIAEAAIEHVRAHPERSIGLVALNQTQTELISMEIDRLAAEHPAFETWRKERDGSLEPFFVKNLENVQGDERDAIFISTVYGKNEEGVLHNRFGPINNDGGHRRLNVLYTRAKCQTVVFTSMDPAEMRVDGSSSFGARALKGYLEFAKRGSTPERRVEGGEGSDAFASLVGAALTRAGLEYVLDVGVGRSALELAVRHPGKPGEFVLGIECDGPGYHESRSTRDRDRIRHEVLRRLQWRIHRIWSVDWFRAPRMEESRLLEAARAAIREAGD
jgi:hypothetical protein